MPFLDLEHISLYVAGKLLINDALLSVNPGDRIGIIGRNGTGKSHLMEHMAGHIPADAGVTKVAKDARILLVKQELPDDDRTPIDYIRDNDPDIQELDAEIEQSSDSNLGDLIQQRSDLDEERYEKLAPKVLTGLGLTEAQLSEPMRQLSGGLRMRISLATALIRTPDVLLLDEPTNHLDLESTQLLIEFLKNYPPQAAFVIVTHDVKLLMEACATTVHLRGGVLTRFNGNYEQYRETLDIERDKDIQRNADLTKQIDRKKEIYYRFRDLPESRAAQATAQLRAAKKLEEKLVDVIKEEPIVELQFKEPHPLPDPVIQLQHVSVGYGANTVLKDLDLSIQYGSKIGLLGRNGEGKSTLIKLLADKLPPRQGLVQRCPRLSIGYFSQDFMDELDSNLTVYQQYSLKTGIKNDAEIRSYLGHYGFSYDKVSTKIANLSGGEKSLLLFALICAGNPGLIILDEPTNHLDVETRGELIKAISQFKGTIILVSHDWSLHEQTMSQFWVASEGTVTVYDKGLKHYERALQRFIQTHLRDEEHARASAPASKSAQSKKPKEAASDEKPAAATAGNRHRFHNAPKPDETKGKKQDKKSDQQATPSKFKK